MVPLVECFFILSPLTESELFLEFWNSVLELELN